ncbi:Tex family protein [Secundilactobacillus kimchicus]|uniref:Tex family protein n=1 Tax=Secundilactobacillus kimchicus TaxID=528209 RepID=UPI0024A83D34|nr:Tex family protein [Secundilactobacillus kimchicus]
MNEEVIKLVKQALPSYRGHQIEATLALIEDGNTVPFIARYRKERTGNLDEVQIREVADTASQIDKLLTRRTEVKNQIEAQGKLTQQLASQLDQATTLQAVEDLYLPYKKKRRTKATIAKEAGLEPLAKWLLGFPETGLSAHVMAATNDQVPDEAAVLAGVHEILAEAIGERAAFRFWIRQQTQRSGQLVSKPKRGGKELDENGVYETYYAFSSGLNTVSSYQVLAINRGEKAGILTVKIDVDEAPLLRYLRFQLIGDHSGPAVAIIEAAYRDAYQRFIKPAIERELRSNLTDKAQAHAIRVFGENLYHLLMQAPLKNQVVMGFDPAYRTGCKLAVVDGNGRFLTKQVIYPHKPAPQAKRQAAGPAFVALLDQYHVDTIAIGNGTASRESEQFVADTIKEADHPVQYTIVNEAGASVYSASPLARQEFPELHVEERSAISIGRRLQDPLAELVKIDPKSVGVGQYQHDVAVSALDDQLARVIETAVNQVGVDVNRASPTLLSHISGLTATTAQNIVTYREAAGGLTSRPELKKVPRLGPKAYEQAVGFLRILDGQNVLDRTDIHPESYPVAKQLLTALHLKLTDVGTPAVSEAVQQANLDTIRTELNVGRATFDDIVTGLQKPGRDPRDSMPAPILRQDVLNMADLKPGMQLQGAVRNVVDFGVFVDIGVKQDGLVHVSQLAQKFVKNPADIVSVGDIVTVWVTEIDEKRQRIQLSMVAPND